MGSRIKNIYPKLKQHGLDGLLLSSPSNISYLLNFTSRESYLLISKKGNIYFTDSRYAHEAKTHLKKIAAVEQIEGHLFKTISRILGDLRLRHVGFEEGYFSMAKYKHFKSELGKGMELVATAGLVEELRQVKSTEELKKIKKATRITMDTFKFIETILSPGKKEIEVAAEIERFIRYSGAQTSAFDIIVASAVNSSFPHHRTSQRKIKNNEHILVDIGVEYSGYKSDLTRIFFLGKITPTVRKVYDIVHRAQQEAIRKIKPGVYINKIDTAARQYITRKGYGGFFGHALGHGIGLEVHEEPCISGETKGTLKPAMVFTVEPAIYLPDKFGIRLEDIILVTQKGHEVLSGALHQ